MKEFFKVLRRFVPPYKKYLVLSLVFTLLSAVLNVFSFMVIIPILQILFKITDVGEVAFIPWSELSSSNAKEVIMNNATYYMNEMPYSGAVDSDTGKTRMQVYNEQFFEKRVASGEIKEIIMATSPNIEGDATAFYITRLLHEYPISITRLARGVTTGSVLEFVNKDILRDALEGRQDYRN